MVATPSGAAVVLIVYQGGGCWWLGCDWKVDEAQEIGAVVMVDGDGGGGGGGGDWNFLFIAGAVVDVLDLLMLETSLMPQRLLSPRSTPLHHDATVIYPRSHPLISCLCLSLLLSFLVPKPIIPPPSSLVINTTIFSYSSHSPPPSVVFAKLPPLTTLPLRIEAKASSTRRRSRRYRPFAVARQGRLEVGRLEDSSWSSAALFRVRFYLCLHSNYAFSGCEE
ncbi:hypothetical protein Tsubulata_011809 [Turnera subulata]|uniref:Uncharacterized protein n=1 Tax=Turnera subulata TaxID=218843 RepID=A0A9Q0FSY8_9ROSI|nr:hypothetical protein Tsubulata_011809 [Turnera subulata]